ncbi:MAG: cupin domain-containing protein [Armatimonadota bacterium]
MCEGCGCGSEKLVHGTISRIGQPWGTEELVSKSHGYTIKRYTIKQGASPDAHTHERETHTFYLVSGLVKLEAGTHVDELVEDFLHAGETAEISAGQIHRLTAIHDSVVIEIAAASSALGACHHTHEQEDGTVVTHSH